MTMESPDTCTFEGRRYAIVTWDGDTSIVPTNQQWGIQTTSKNSANWRGRIDHFVVCHGRLYLLKAEITLADGHALILPKGAEREVLCRYETMQSPGDDGMREVVREHRFEYLVFHDLPVPYTGNLHLSYPYVDYWDQPYAADDEDEESTAMTLAFAEGVLVGSSQS